MSSGTYSRAMKGWLAGCAAATAVIAGFAWIIVALAAVTGGDLDRFVGGTMATLLAALLVFPIACLMTGFPTAAIAWVSERFAIRSIWFFACAGGFIGILSDAVLAGLLGRTGPTYFSGLFAAAGVVAGIAYWRVAGRHAGRDVSKGMT